MEELFRIMSPCVSCFWFLLNTCLFILIGFIYKGHLYKRIDAKEGSNNSQRISSKEVCQKKAEDDKDGGRFDLNVADRKIDDAGGIYDRRRKIQLLYKRFQYVSAEPELIGFSLEEQANSSKNELVTIMVVSASFLWFFLNTFFFNLMGFIYRAYCHKRIDVTEGSSLQKISEEEEYEKKGGDEKKEGGWFDQSVTDHKIDDDDGSVYCWRDSQLSCKRLHHLSAEQEVIELSLEDQSDSSQTDFGLKKGGTNSSMHTTTKIDEASNSNKERTSVMFGFLKARDFGGSMEAMNYTRGLGDLEMEVSSSVGSNCDIFSENGTTESTFDDDEFLTEADFICVKPRPISLYLSSLNNLEEETTYTDFESFEDFDLNYEFLGEKYDADEKIELVFFDAFPKPAEVKEAIDENEESPIANSVSNKQRERINGFLVQSCEVTPKYVIGDEESIGDASSYVATQTEGSENHDADDDISDPDDLLQYQDSQNQNSCENQGQNLDNTHLRENIDHHTNISADVLMHIEPHKENPIVAREIEHNQVQNDLIMTHLDNFEASNNLNLDTNNHNSHSQATNNQNPDILLIKTHNANNQNFHSNDTNNQNLGLEDHKNLDSEDTDDLLITTEDTNNQGQNSQNTIQNAANTKDDTEMYNPHFPTETREDSINKNQDIHPSSLEFDSEDELEIRGDQKARSSPSSGWAEEADEEGFEELWEHQEFIEQLRSDLRKARATGLPTIMEESEWPMEKVMDDLKQWKTMDKRATADRDPIDELHKFYKSYSQRMRRFDVLNYQKMYAMGFLKLQDPIQALSSVASQKLNIRVRPNRKSETQRPSAEFLRELQVDLETVYVGQMCLSWEFLHWQFIRTQEQLESNPQDWRNFNQVAEEFQSFLVLLTRFTEDEQFKGPRVHNYVNSRCVHRNLLQVPLVKDDEGAEIEGEEGRSLQNLEQVMEECIRAFWEFVKRDRDEVGPIMKGLKQVQTKLQNLSDSKLLADIQASAQKKDKRLKELVKSGSCLVKRFQKRHGGWMNESVFFSLVDVKLVKRVLRMTRLTREQLDWCHNKLLNITFEGRNKLVRDHSFLLFPC